MLERFTEEARRVIAHSVESARLLNDLDVGPEHLLLGIVEQQDGVAAAALGAYRITREGLMLKIKTTEGPPIEAATNLTFTSEARTSLERALREALQLNEPRVGTDHLFLALIRPESSRITAMLADLGVSREELRADILWRLSAQLSGARAGSVAARPMAMPLSQGVGGSAQMLCSFCQRDLWEVDHYVSAGAVVICATRLDEAQAALQRAPAAEREVSLPPRVFGRTPDPEAVSAIARAVRVAFGGGYGRHPEIAAVIEDFEELGPLIAEAGQRFPVHLAGARVDRIRFLGQSLADSRFQIILANGPSFTFDGRLAHREGRWMVTRDTVAAVLGRAGITVSPPRELTRLAGCLAGPGQARWCWHEDGSPGDHLGRLRRVAQTVSETGAVRRAGGGRAR